MKINKTFWRSAIGLAISTVTMFSGCAMAKELPVGTEVSKANIDAVKDDTFEGHKISEMLPERVEWQIKNHNLKIKLRHSEALDLDPKYVDATKKYAKSVKYDQKTKEVTGWVAGMPFPSVDMADPDAGTKLIWNRYLAFPIGDAVNYSKFAFLLIDGASGLERVQHWVMTRYSMKGRLNGDPVEGDGSVLSNTLLYATYPQDIKGLGTFTARYDSSKVEDQWAYIKSVRRIRRLSGGSWMDPVGGTDELNDDIENWNARPSWYSGFKLIGKRWILAVAHTTAGKGKTTRGTWNNVPDAKNGTSEEFPYVDLKTAPYWNPIAQWEPKEVYVIEATPPSTHPYGKRVMYMDVSYPRIYMQEVYDKKGQFWKYLNFLTDPIIGKDGYTASVSIQGHIIDFQRNHGTVFSTQQVAVNPSELKAKDVTLGVLEATALGKQ